MWGYFNSIIEWVGGIFRKVRKIVLVDLLDSFSWLEVIYNRKVFGFREDGVGGRW